MSLGTVGLPPQKVLLTGANGYVGSEIVRQLLAMGADVHAIVNRNSETIATLLEPHQIHPIASDFSAVEALVRELEPDTIFHLAAVHAEPPSFEQMMAMVNCSMLLGVALLHGAQTCTNPPVIVHAGTYWQFDGGVYQPHTFYAAAKQALHDLLAYYRVTHAVSSVTLVLYDIFGPNDLRPKLWTKLRDSRPGTVLPLSEGRQLIELVHVSDVALAFLHAAALLREGVPLEPFHAVRSGVRMTLRELLEQVKQKAALPIKFQWGAVPYWPGQIFEPWHGLVLPAWRPKIHPVDGLVAMLTAPKESV